VRVRARIDTTKPVFRIIRAPEPVIDVRDGDKRAVTLIRAIDAESGVAFVGLGSFDSDDPLLPGRLVSGTRHNGLWRVEVPLPQCGTPAWEWADVLSAHDRSWNGNEVVREVHYRVINTDVIPPTIRNVRSGETVKVEFSERVTGLTNASAPIRAVLSSPRHRRALGAPLEGTWTCRTKSGTAVDCPTGAFRLAAWRPTTPLDPAQAYIVDVNPEHVLDITDLAGNPFDGRTAYSDTTF
jgi:hypothetical protein